MAVSVLAFYIALFAWVPLGVWSYRTKRWLPFLVYGLVFAVVLNGRYVVEGMENGIMFFTGIFDVVANLGADDSAEILTSCAGNACTVMTDYDQHPSWAVAFYDRFTTGPSLRTTLLFGHIIFNTIALILVTAQIYRPGGKYTGHKTVGRIGISCVVISLICAGWLNSELSDVGPYGGVWTMLGLYFLAATVLVPAGAGVVAIVSGDAERHRIWMWRFAGALWGSYWIFRAEMMLVDLLVKSAEGFTLAIPSWTAGLIGIGAAEVIRRRSDRRIAARTEQTERPSAAAPISR